MELYGGAYMQNYRQITPAQFSGNPFSLIGSEWMLVAAAKPDGKINFMTASWGGLGVLWNRNVCFIFVRPSRYTYEFTEAADNITLSFFDANYRSALNYCGTKSGRDADKLKECGLHAENKDGFVTFEEAKLTINTKKLYASPIEARYFIDKSIIDNPSNLHKMYVCEIESIFESQ